MEVNTEELENALEIIIGVIVGFPVSVAILGSEISVNICGNLYNFDLIN